METATRARVLVVEDDRDMRDLLADALGRRGFVVMACASGVEALESLERADPDVVVTDIHMAGLDGLELCRRLTALRPAVPVIVITAFGSLETAIGGIRAGAWDFVTKPFEIETIAIAIDRAARHKALTEEVRRLREVVASSTRFEGLLGASPAMLRLFDLLNRVADSDATALVTGESGTGKELVARALHRLSRRRTGPFVAVNCAAVPETLLESELFGHARGAFTDARAPRAGLFLQAHGGTLLLDEIGELPLSLQPKLLRAVQERSVRPVGGDREVPFDVRIVVATNRDLATAVEEGRFRQDLYYRFDVVHLEVPPLRARTGDALLLAQHFLEGFAARGGKRVTGIARPAAEKLLAYDWPGNVRELQNCMERAVALTRYEQVTLEDLPERVRGWRPSQIVLGSDDPSELAPLEEIERRYILKVLGAVGGNKTEAARVLGLDRKTLYRKLERYGVSSD
ncbi:MAG: sigma-54 dependent transcriptional regulator [Myxococcota bacterium]